MPYVQLLSDLINAKGLTVKEVAERCKKYGLNITAAYISIIKNSDNKKIPSDDVSRALARACEATNEECLVVEAYVDKSPAEMKIFFEKIRDIIINSVTMIFQNSFSEVEIKALRQNLRNMAIADLIIEFGNTNEVFSKPEGAFNTKSTFTDEKIELLLEMKQPQGIEMPDDSMFPTIPKGSKVVSELKGIDDYQDGEILVVVVKGDKKIIIRKCLFNESKREKVTLYGLNQGFAPVTCSLDEISILGKVRTVITEL